MIPAHVLESVRAATDLPALVESAGQRLRSQTGRKIGFCPFCPAKQRTPAFAVYRDHFYCHRCQATGTAIDWVVRMEGMRFPEAVRSLADRAGISVTGEFNPVRRVAAVEDGEPCRWWWAQRWNSVRAELDRAMADREIDDEWADCLGRLLRSIETMPPAEKLQEFRCSVTAGERRAYREDAAWDRDFAAAFLGLVEQAQAVAA